MPEMYTLESRQQSFFLGRAWPHPLSWTPSPDSAGFFYDPISTEPHSDNVTCYLCHKSLDGWEETDDPWAEHLSHSPKCPLVILHRSRLILAQKTSSESEKTVLRLGKLEVTQPTPKELDQARLKTFESVWPHDDKRSFHPSSKRMAKAGFAYFPADEGEDMVECVQCGLALDGWEADDDPVTEHQKRARKCPFFKGASAMAPTGGKRKVATAKLIKKDKDGDTSTLVAVEESDVSTATISTVVPRDESVEDEFTFTASPPSEASKSTLQQPQKKRTRKRGANADLSTISMLSSASRRGGCRRRKEDQSSMMGDVSILSQMGTVLMDTDFSFMSTATAASTMRTSQRNNTTSIIADETTMDTGVAESGVDDGQEDLLAHAELDGPLVEPERQLIVEPIVELVAEVETEQTAEKEQTEIVEDVAEINVRVQEEMNKRVKKLRKKPKEVEPGPVEEEIQETDVGETKEVEEAPKKRRGRKPKQQAAVQPDTFGEPDQEAPRATRSRRNHKLVEEVVEVVIEVDKSLTEKARAKRGRKKQNQVSTEATSTIIESAQPKPAELELEPEVKPKTRRGRKAKHEPSLVAEEISELPQPPMDEEIAQNAPAKRTGRKKRTNEEVLEVLIPAPEKPAKRGRGRAKKDQQVQPASASEKSTAVSSAKTSRRASPEVDGDMEKSQHVEMSVLEPIITAETAGKFDGEDEMIVESGEEVLDEARAVNDVSQQYVDDKENIQAAAASEQQTNVPPVVKEATPQKEPSPAVETSENKATDQHSTTTTPKLDPSHQPSVFDDPSDASFPFQPEDLDLTVEQLLKKLHAKHLDALKGRNQEMMQDFTEFYDGQLKMLKERVEIVD